MIREQDLESGKVQVLAHLYGGLLFNQEGSIYKFPLEPVDDHVRALPSQSNGN
jgi:hypothetical protein